MAESGAGHVAYPSESVVPNLKCVASIAGHWLKAPQ